MPSPSQYYDIDHKQFVDLLQKGYDPLVIGRKLGLSLGQIKRHEFDAFKQGLMTINNDSTYLVWKKLSRDLKKLLPSDDEHAILKVNTTKDGLILELVKEKPSDSEKNINNSAD